MKSTTSCIVYFIFARCALHLPLRIGLAYSVIHIYSYVLRLASTCFETVLQHVLQLSLHFSQAFLQKPFVCCCVISCSTCYHNLYVYTYHASATSYFVHAVPSTGYLCSMLSGFAMFRHVKIYTLSPRGGSRRPRRRCQRRLGLRGGTSGCSASQRTRPDPT